MRIISEIGKIFRKEDTEDKKFTAAQTWGIIEGMVNEKDSIRFDVAKKIPKEELSPDLRGWKFYDDVGDSFKVEISSKFGLQQITLRTGSHYMKIVTRGLGDLVPTISEGRSIQNGAADFPFTSEIGQDSLSFAHDLTKFVWAHWRNTQLQPAPKPEVL